MTKTVREIRGELNEAAASLEIMNGSLSAEKTAQMLRDYAFDLQHQGDDDDLADLIETDLDCAPIEAVAAASLAHFEMYECKATLMALCTVIQDMLAERKASLYALIDEVQDYAPMTRDLYVADYL